MCVCNTFYKIICNSQETVFGGSLSHLQTVESM